MTSSRRPDASTAQEPKIEPVRAGSGASRASSSSGSTDVAGATVGLRKARFGPPDLSSPARRTADLSGRIATDDPEQRLDLAARLADETVQLVAVNTEDLRQACLAAKPLFN